VPHSAPPPVGAAGLASSAQPANAPVITGTTALLAGGAIAGAAGGAGLASSPTSLATKIESVLGQGEDLSGYTGKEEALRTQIEEQSLTMQTVDERVFTLLNRIIS